MTIKLEKLSRREKIEEWVEQYIENVIILGFYANLVLSGVGHIQEIIRPRNILSQEGIEQICNNPEEGMKWDQCRKIYKGR